MKPALRTTTHYSLLTAFGRSPIPQGGTARRKHPSLTVGARIGRLLTLRQAPFNCAQGRQGRLRAALTIFLCFGPAIGSLWAQGGEAGPPRYPLNVAREAERVQNCRRDFACFSKAFEEGRAGRVEQVHTGVYDGALNTATVSLQFSHFTPETVVYYIKWEDYKLQFTEEGRQQALQRMTRDELARKEKEHQEIQDTFKGRDGACLFRREVVRGFLERWSKGEGSLNDYQSAEQCEGSAVIFPRNRVDTENRPQPPSPEPRRTPEPSRSDSPTPPRSLAGLSQFAGRWRNDDPETRGVTTLDIVVSGSTVTVQAWGSCSPTDCDWGRVDAQAYAPSVSSNLVETAEALVAVFATDRFVLLHPSGNDRLRAEVLVRFRTGGSRTSYRNVHSFSRLVP